MCSTSVTSSSGEARPPATDVRGGSGPGTKLQTAITLFQLSLITIAAAAAAALAREADRRRIAGGILCTAFGAGSAAVAADRAGSVAGSGSVSLAVDGGFAVAGALLLLAAGFAAWSGPARQRAPAALVVAVAVLLGWLSRALIGAAGLPADLAAAVILALGFGSSRAIRWATRGRSPRPGLSSPLRPASRSGVPRLIAGALGALAAMAGPSVWVVAAGALVAAAASSLVLAGVAAVGLLPGLWFMRTVAGPVGLRIATLGDVPFSAAAEALLAPTLAVGAFGFFNLWPLRRWGTAALVPVGVALLLRLGGGVSAGMESWQTVLVPVGIVALIHALITSEPPEAVAAGAWLASVTGGGAAAVLLAAAALALVATTRIQQPHGVAARWLRGAAWAAVAPGGALALESLLAHQVVYAVLGTALVAALISLPAPRES